VSLLGTDNPTRIPGAYIVLYNETVSAYQFNTHLKRVGDSTPLKFVYSIGDTYKGFAANLDDETLERLLDDPLIKEIHCDGMESIVANSCGATQPNAPSWGIPRTSHKGEITNGVSDDYFYNPSEGGQGVYIYVIDTGVYAQHSDFGGRAIFGANFVDNVETDQNSHGTHCAGTAAGRTFGIAKAATIVSVKVLGAGGSGPTSGVIAGFQYTTQRHVATGGPSVASVSLGSTADGGKNAAVTASIQQGVAYSIAAGNSNANACNFYPASTPLATTVGSTTMSTFDEETYDERSSFSNFGTCVDIFAPGTSITSCCISGPNSSCVKSGTSMACPHVSGQLAVVLGEHRDWTPAQAEAELLRQAQSGLIYNQGGGSPNLLLYNGCDEA
jgi:subtilisin family serine protease